MIGNHKRDRVFAFWLAVMALVVRLFVITSYPVPNVVYIPIEIFLCIGALFFERDRLPDFFIYFKNWKFDLLWGCILAAVWCSAEYYIEGVKSAEDRAFYWQSFLMIPVFILIAGWRAGVYEELLFRSLLMGYSRLHFKRPLAFILIQALFFWFAHPRYYLAGQWFNSATNALFGILMGIIVYKRGSILPAIIIHSIANTYGIIGLPLDQAFSKAMTSWLK